MVRIVVLAIVSMAIVSMKIVLGADLLKVNFFVRSEYIMNVQLCTVI